MTAKEEGAQLLMLALPHHADVLSSSSSSSGCTLLGDENDFDLVYRTIKGHMTPVVGSTWSYDETLTSIGFDDPDNALENVAKLDAQTRAIILDQVVFDVRRVLPTLDENVYGYGKQVARLAQLVHIANVLLRTSSNETETDTSSYSTLIKDSTSKLHYFVTAFLSGKNTDVLVYDVNFGGLVTRDGLLDFMGDFGNGW
jgi:endoglucanase Acf2